VDYKAIINLMKEMNQTDLTRLEVEAEGLRICLEKADPKAAAASPAQFVQPALIQGNSVPVPNMSASVSVIQGANDQVQAAGPAAQAEKAAEEGTKKLISPMVGTFYAQPAPDKPPFVKVGDKVKKGQTICIIEAMKLMNEIESEYDGEILEVLVKNEEMVEYGQPLFLIR
jgi:acetyl-CoA carboxylase biotin carboxyl carrier protein